MWAREQWSARLSPAAEVEVGGDYAMSRGPNGGLAARVVRRVRLALLSVWLYGLQRAIEEMLLVQLSTQWSDSPRSALCLCGCSCVYRHSHGFAVSTHSSPAAYVIAWRHKTSLNMHGPRQRGSERRRHATAQQTDEPSAASAVLLGPLRACAPCSRCCDDVLQKNLLARPCGAVL